MRQALHQPSPKIDDSGKQGSTGNFFGKGWNLFGLGRGDSGTRKSESETTV
jgi:hypothetical protein